MNRNTATSFALSFLLVAVTAVVFYQPDRPPPRVSANGPNPAHDSKKPTYVPTPERANSFPAKSSLDRATSPSSTPTSPPRRPISAFTTVQEGESLADIAVRVYGTPETTDLLLRANRDQIDRFDDKPPAGTVLRTPEVDATAPERR